jgi:hypothetical protein
LCGNFLGGRKNKNPKIVWQLKNINLIFTFLSFLLVGTGFLILQALSFSGYIKVDHVKIEGKFKDLLDVNDDGKIDQEDRDEIMAKVMEIAEFGMPSGGGFAAGFIGGAKSG